MDSEPAGNDKITKSTRKIIPAAGCIPRITRKEHCLARALYDNVPDTPDELQFRKGDTLVVLEQNTANIEGWWLCSLRGKQTHRQRSDLGHRIIKQSEYPLLNACQDKYAHRKEWKSLRRPMSSSGGHRVVMKGG
ncbi:unnamed protein product [Diabrotica balteata]|uniref:SH3 domain-containing protein n=1 Tax=Diabrotica balteata TaxID=107213 RepID=A0A9N9T208_DIABA|nr:unnamed protein product [Diabrotica balteata]